MAWKGKTLLGMRFGVEKAAWISANAFATALPMSGNRIMNQCFDSTLL
jgi:hypothetical protein